MEQVALRLDGADSWTHLGGRAEGKRLPSVVVRAVDGDVVVTTGETENAPDDGGTLVPRGQGRRVQGRHVFVRPAPPAGPRLITYRGI